MKTIKTTYDKMCDEVNEILESRGAKEIYLRFSIFESIDDIDDNDDKWPIQVVDFDQEFANGKAVFETDYAGNYKSKIYENPTWKDVIYEANQFIIFGVEKLETNGWDHVFLELVGLEKEEDGVKYFNMWFGS